ncbi:MAG: hypothetical protein V1923_01380 [Candidatus Omnitrophota bacterium]
MMSEKDKSLFVKDGRSLIRKKNFRNAKKMTGKASGSLDDYIIFLTQIEKVFPFVYDKKKPITAYNKL